jgi:hypothetical protein
MSCFRTQIIAVLILLITLNLPAQKRVLITGSEIADGRTANALVIEPVIRSVLIKNGFTMIHDSTAPDFTVKYSATSRKGSMVNNFAFVFVDAEISVYNNKEHRDIYSNTISGTKGGGINYDAARQKALQTAARMLADSVNKAISAGLPAIQYTENKPVQPVITPSDVDLNIPESPGKNQNIYALIIGNEDYKSFQAGLADEINVAFAMRDASIFKEYVNKTLGVPEENIKLLINARSVEMHREIKKLASYIKALGGDAEIIIYYAGHGLPDEVTHEPFLMPVDVSGTDLQFAVKLTSVYSTLTATPTHRITLFLDACFSGGARDQGLIAARGVKIKPKEGVMAGNLVVFSASSGEQSSMAYQEKNHGMFTYFLLKKIRETRGNISYKALSDYLSREVAVTSLRINGKEQNPQVSVGEDALGQWESWMLKK